MLIQIESLKPSKNQALLDGETKNVQEKGKQKGKDKKKTERKPKEKKNPSNGALGSKKDKKKRFEETKCPYCKRGDHPENICIKKTIDHMSRINEENNIVLPEGIRKTNSRSKDEYHERFHALKVGFSQSQAFLIDSGASNHMVASKESFYSLDLIGGPSIHMGDDSRILAIGMGSVQFEYGVFNNVLYVPSLATNLVYVYQMTHTSSPKQVVFELDIVEI